MNELLTQEEIKIENMIYEIRGKQVMLDSDLAKLYQVETKRINEAVKNNPNKFPERFSFKLTDTEVNKFLVENFDQKIEMRGGRYKNPRVFTEQGIAMLATILKSHVAIQVSINIMDAFVAMRKYISSDLINQKYINNMVIKHDNDIKLLQESFNKLESKELKNAIYFEGQIYDAYSKIIDIMKHAKEKLVIIDSYADKSVLDMISNIKIKVILITKPNQNLKELDINKYNKQYHNLEVIYNISFHDRYFILDNTKVYHCGTSLNHAGSKTFSINKLEDDMIINLLIDKINNLIK
jgi:hypothetical protein